MATPMDPKKLANVAQHLINVRRQEAPRLSEIRERTRDRIIDIYVPDKASVEYRQLVEQSKFNIMPLLIQSLADNHFIDGYRPRRSSENAKVWDEVWQPNRMDARQAGLWRPAVQFGISYSTVLPGKIGTKKTAVLKPWSPTRMTAVYADPTSDEWPLYAMSVGAEYPEITADGVKMVTPVTIYDDNFTYVIEVPSLMLATAVYGQRPPHLPEIAVSTDGAKSFAHDLGVCPVVRFMETWGELDDGPEGVVWPSIPAQKRLNQTTYSLGMAEHFSAFKQKWVTGIEIQRDENGTPIEPFQVALDKLLQAESDLAKFGEFGQTDLNGYLDSRDRTLLYIATTRRKPPHSMIVGNAVSNISAEALAALQNGEGQAIAAQHKSFGESAEQQFRLASKAMGDPKGWEDYSSEVRWADTTPRSLAQVADALGKLATMLEIPPEALWERVPDTSDQDLENWAKKAKERDSMAKLNGVLNDARSSRPPANPPAPSSVGSNSS